MKKVKLFYIVKLIEGDFNYYPQLNYGLSDDLGSFTELAGILNNSNDDPTVKFMVYGVEANITKE